MTHQRKNMDIKLFMIMPKLPLQKEHMNAKTKKKKQKKKKMTRLSSEG